MHTMPIFSPRERPLRMHHRKQKNGSGTAAVGKSIGRRESGMEAMTRLRYLNKKPLCLQYNVPGSSYARKHYVPGAKRKEQSFIVVIICGIAKLMQWAAVGFQQAAVDFLVKPAHELFPDEFPKQCFETSFYHNPIQNRRRPTKRAIVRRSDVSRMLQSFDTKLF